MCEEQKEETEAKDYDLLSKMSHLGSTSLVLNRKLHLLSLILTVGTSLRMVEQPVSHVVESTSDIVYKFYESSITAHTKAAWDTSLTEENSSLF